MYGFNPSFTPYPPQQRTELIRVNGMDGARAYQMPPNSTAALFDSCNDILYIKQTDGAGFASIRIFEFTEQAPQPQPKATPFQPDDYVKREEFDQLKETLKRLMEDENHAKQSVSGKKQYQPNGTDQAGR